MKNTQLYPRKFRNQIHFDFRQYIPRDLIPYFKGKTKFQISLKDVSNKETLLVSVTLQNLIKELFQDIRQGMKDLDIEDIKEILRTEVRKSILHSHHVDLGTNKYDSMKKIESVETISNRETDLKKSVLTELKSVEESVDQKLQSILESLDINVDPKSVNHKRLRRSFIDLYLLRNQWTKDLINETGRTDDDFRREVDEKLKMNLFPELEIPPSVQVQIGDQILNPVIENLTPEPPQPYRVERPQSSHQSIKISEGIEKYLDDKTDDDLRSKTSSEIKYSLSLLIEDFGDIPISSINVEKGTQFKSHLKNFPKNRNKLPKFRDKTFHEIMGMKIKDSERISLVTLNKHIGYVSSFMNWCQIYGYADVNPFKGMKQKIKVRPSDQRSRFSEKELKQIFNKENYVHFTNIEGGRYELFWVPLISVFSGMRMGEITPLYLDNIRSIQGNHRNSRWCFDILEESDRPDKKLKTLSSRRIVPIHDTLIEIGFIEFIELLKKKDPKRKRVFEELPYGDNGYNRNVTRFFNTRYLPKLGLKTDKKNFHSLRHTVIDHLKQKGIEPHFINELVGHTSGNIDLDRYGKGYNPDIIYNKCIKQIAYETSHTRGIDFKYLKMDWGKIIQ